MTNLQDIEELKKACADAIKIVETETGYMDWGERLQEFLRYVRDADEETRASIEFQQRIWNENPVSGAGQGNISVETAIQDGSFRNWLAERSLHPLPQATEARVEALAKLEGEIEGRLSEYTSRMPRLKIYRVLAGFFPTDFNAVSHERKLRALHCAMIGSRQGSASACHRDILSKLREALGDPGDDVGPTADRLRLPWLLFKDYVAPSEEEPTEITLELPGEERLVPLPAARRRRGLTGFSGEFQAVLNVLEFCRDGVTREDLKSQIRSISPNLKDSSIATQINVLGNYSPPTGHHCRESIA